MTSSDDLAAIERIATPCGRSLLAELTADSQPLTPAMVGRLRDQHGRAVADWLCTFARHHARAVEKLGTGVWMTTERAVQQSTDRITARYKAQRFPRHRTCHDLCCGIGGDAIALAARTASVLAVDADACTAAMAAGNLQAAAEQTPGSGMTAVVCGDASAHAPQSGGIVHIDPDRRPGGRRTTDPDHYTPPLEEVQRIVAAADGAAVKLAPAAQLPQPWCDAAEREWISLGGRVRQQVAWFGCLRRTVSAGPPSTAAGWRRATRLDAEGGAWHFAAVEDDVSRPAEIQADCGRFLVDFDPAIRAAGLSSAFSLHHRLAALGGLAGFFTSDQPPPADRLLQSFQVLWQGPADLRGLRRRQRALGVRIGTVKVRGSDQRPDVLVRRLAATEPAEPADQAVLLISRIGGQTWAAITLRVS